MYCFKKCPSFQILPVRVYEKRRGLLRKGFDVRAYTPRRLCNRLWGRIAYARNIHANAFKKLPQNKNHISFCHSERSEETTFDEVNLGYISRCTQDSPLRSE